MKNFLKNAAVLLMVTAMALVPVAADEAVLVAAPEDAAVEVKADPIPVTLPASLKFAPITVTSSITADGTDPSPLYDLDAATSVTFAKANVGVSISFTSSNRFRLANVLLNKPAADVDAVLYASKDGQTWTKLNSKVLDKDNGFLEVDVIALGRAYKFYKLELTADEEALELHTVAPTVETRDSKYTGFSLRGMTAPFVFADYPVQDIPAPIK